MLPDGRLLLGNLDNTNTAIFDPASDSWTAGPAKGAAASEESWVLLPDETVVTVRCNSSNLADKYVASSNTWVSGGTLPVGIVELASSEIGAGVLLNNGHAFFAGATNHTAVYTPPAVASDPGTWTQGPDFPNDSMGQTVGCKDTPSCLMTNGKVLIAAGPVDGVGNDWLTPTYFFEYDGASLNRAADPPNATNVPYIGRMLLIPTGQILFAAQTNELYAYTYSGCPDASWRPQITSYPSDVTAGFTYTIQGVRFNGMSQAVGYGDDAAAATNYPLVRIRHIATGAITYCRYVRPLLYGCRHGIDGAVDELQRTVRHACRRVGDLRRRQRHLVAVLSTHDVEAPLPVAALRDSGSASSAVSPTDHSGVSALMGRCRSIPGDRSTRRTCRRRRTASSRGSGSSKTWG